MRFVTRYSVLMTLELNRNDSTAEQLNSLLTQIMENFSVSDYEGPLADEVEAFFNEQKHLTVRRHGDTWWPAPILASRIA